MRETRSLRMLSSKRAFPIRQTPDGPNRDYGKPGQLPSDSLLLTSNRWLLLLLKLIVVEGIGYGSLGNPIYPFPLRWCCPLHPFFDFLEHLHGIGY